MTVTDADALLGFLPLSTIERIDTALPSADLATLAHLARAGTGENSLRALASDLAYLEAWSLAATGAALGWPASQSAVLQFIAHHLWDVSERDRNPDHGMPETVALSLRRAGRLRAVGPHAPATVRRRLAVWATLHRWRGVDGPFAAPLVRNALRLAIRAADRPRKRKSARPVTRDVLDDILATCDRGRTIDVRDRALLLLAFASGGRRRSEIARLRYDDVLDRPPVPVDPAEPDGLILPVVALQLRRTKTASADGGELVQLVGRPVRALRAWLNVAKIEEGTVFRAIDKRGKIGSRPLNAQSVNKILKRRCVAAGLDPMLYSAHGLRSGYITEAARQGVPLLEAMQQSRHRSVQQAADYYNEAQLARGRAARLG